MNNILFRIVKAICRSEKRQIVASIIAIVLTTTLFTMVFTVYNNMHKTVDEGLMRQAGGKAQATISLATKEEYNRIKNDESIDQISYTVLLGELTDVVGTEIRVASDEVEATNDFSNPTVGRLPDKDNEIAMDKSVLEILGYPAQIGEEINISYSVADVEMEGSFVLAGYWDRDKALPASYIWVSESYYDSDYIQKIISSYRKANPDSVIGMIEIGIIFNDGNNIESQLDAIISNYNIDPNTHVWGVNEAYTGNATLGVGAWVSVISIILFIILCGYLMISNMFEIGISNKVHIYGLLKAIGCTKKQMKAIVGYQAGIILCVGAPIGVLVGISCNKVLMPIIIKQFDVIISTDSFDFKVLLFSVLFSVITIALSIFQPIKTLSGLSIISAINSSDVDKKSAKIKVKKISSVYNLSLYNVLRNRKRTVLVVLSIMMTMTLVNGIYSFSTSFDLDRYISNSIVSDYSVASNDYYSDYEPVALDKGLISYINNMNIIDDVGYMYYEEQADDDGNILQIYGVNRKSYENIGQLERHVTYDELLQEGGTLLVQVDDDSLESTYSDKVSFIDNTGIMETREIINVVNMPYCISCGYALNDAMAILLPEEDFIKLFGKEKLPYMALLYSSANSEINTLLNNYISSNGVKAQYLSREKIKEEFYDTQNSFILVGISFSCLIALISIINFLNTMVVSIMERRRELSILKCIGMTRKQMYKMLNTESVISIIISILLSVTIGAILLQISLKTLLDNSAYADLHISVLPSVICGATFVILSLFITRKYTKDIESFNENEHI